MLKIIDQNEETKRVLDVFNNLKKNQKISGVSDFCKKCGFNRPSFSSIKNGKLNAPLSLIYGVISAFNVSRDYIFDGKGEMFINNKREPFLVLDTEEEMDIIENIFKDAETGKKFEIPSIFLEKRLEQAIKDDEAFNLAYYKISSFRKILSDIIDDYKKLFEEPFNEMLQKIATIDQNNTKEIINASPNFKKNVLSYNKKISPLFDSLLLYPSEKKFLHSNPPLKENKSKLDGKKPVEKKK